MNRRKKSSLHLSCSYSSMSFLIHRNVPKTSEKVEKTWVLLKKLKKIKLSTNYSTVDKVKIGSRITFQRDSFMLFLITEVSRHTIPTSIPSHLKSVHGIYFLVQQRIELYFSAIYLNGYHIQRLQNPKTPQSKTNFLLQKLYKFH